MYLTQLRLKNVKCFTDIELSFQSDRNNTRQQNWNVILGDNAAGKTTLLQAIAACLTTNYYAEKMPMPKFTRYGQNYSRYTLKLVAEPNDLAKSLPPSLQEYTIELGRTIASNYNKTEIFMPPSGTRTTIDDKQVGLASVQNLQEWQAMFNPEALDNHNKLQQTYMFSSEKLTGWISCGYGALRRARGSTTQGTYVEDNSLEERFVTLFIEEAALYKGEEWLKDLERLALKSDPHSPAPKKFTTVKETLINILPDIEDLDIDERLRFIQGNNKYTLDELSDGYRTMFILTIDILRWLDWLNADPNIPLNHAAGVVLIDEIDAHLHPKWQRIIGFELTRIFPNLQFIVTTHSPYVAMAAGKGALTVLEKVGDEVMANQNVPFVRDWTVDRILNDLFHESKYSVEVESDLQKYDKLQTKKQRGELTKTELQQLIDLTNDLNQRLGDDDNSPKQQMLNKYLAKLDQLLEE